MPSGKSFREKSRSLTGGGNDDDSPAPHFGRHPGQDETVPVPGCNRDSLTILHREPGAEWSVDELSGFVGPPDRLDGAQSACCTLRPE
jgi:hypothetical protein